MKESNRIRLITTIVILIIIISYIFTKGIYSAYKEHTRVSQKIIADYNNLFINPAQQKLKILTTVETNTRNPESNYLYQDKFKIHVYKMNLKVPTTLTHIIHEKNESTDGITSFFSPIADNHYLKMSLKMGKPDSISDIHFTYSGDSFQRLTKNDSLACYFLKLGSFAISYNDNDDDISGNASSDTKIPMSILFLKRQMSMYVIIMRSNDESIPNMPPSILYDIVKH